MATEYPRSLAWRDWLAVLRNRWVAIAVAALVVSSGAALAWWTFRSPEYDFIAFDHQRAYDDIVALTEIGPRQAGTTGERQGAEYVAAQFNASGLADVEIHEFPWTLYEVDQDGGRPAVTLAYEDRTNPFFPDRQERELEHHDDFLVLGYSGSRTDSDLELVFAGNGDDENYSAAGDVSGRAVLVESDGSFSYSILYLRALEHDAAMSLVFDPGHEWPIAKTSIGYDEHDHLIPFPDAYPDQYDGITPHLMVSDEAGRQMKQWIDDAAQDNDDYALLDVDIEVTVETRDVMVVTGDVPGASPEVVMLGAHMDTHYVGSGAVDNTVGTAIVIELARQLAGSDDLAYTLRFATWGGEEIGLLGSYGYYKAYRATLQQRLVMYQNFDMAHADGEDGANRIPLEANHPSVRDGLREVRDAWEDEYPALAQTYQVPVTYREEAGPSDHRTFNLEGIPSATSYGSGSEEYHTRRDTIEHLNPESLQVAPLIQGTYALHVALEGTL